MVNFYIFEKTLSLSPILAITEVDLLILDPYFIL